MSWLMLAVVRQGSGSACRSMYGGFVEWTVGSRNDGTDSVARQIATEHDWPNLHVLILVVLSSCPQYNCFSISCCLL